MTDPDTFHFGPSRTPINLHPAADYELPDDLPMPDRRWNAACFFAAGVIFGITLDAVARWWLL